jgi:3-oxoacyl-(acyl-carrier-protein) synthase/malonyl CoA-acyl carrier protein transacylase/phosphopantetheinyl transferase (holo-ACP synthase)
MTDDGRGIAIVGMACTFPGAPDLETFRRNIEGGVDAITDLPPGRWDPVYFDPGSDAPDRIYCRRGGFIGDSVLFDPVPYGIMPIAAQGAEPDQMLALQLVARALEDAGLRPDRDLPSEKTSVILGRGGYPGARMVAGIQHTRAAEQLVEALRSLIPDISAHQLAAVKEEFVAQLGHYGGDTAIGLVPNIAASRIANRFDLHGSAYTVDAACASSLIALDHGVHELLAGRADLIITGGVHLCDDLSFWNIFSRLGALSRSQVARPFDRRADGLLIGEGIGILVLKRLRDAERDGDRVYAVIRGVGTASDGRERSLMLPSVGGQLLALERAWRATGLAPEEIGLLEAHGTGTPNGDQAELLTITRFFGGRFAEMPVLGSVKSMIGHAMPAAGAAGLIKAALALHHGFLPPTLHCEEPHELVAATGFRLLAVGEPWDPARLPRLAAVNAFGFGGINAHVVLSAPPRATGATLTTPSVSGPGATPYPEMYLAAADSADALSEALAAGRSAAATGPHRLVIEDPTPRRRELARDVVRRGKRWNGRNGIWYVPDGGLAAGGGRIAFLYPGVDGQFAPRLADVAAHFGRELPPFHDARDDLVGVSTGIVACGRWLTEILDELGIRPDLAAGHSIGEWSGMAVCGITVEEESDDFVARMVPSLRLDVPGVAFAAVGCGLARAETAIAGLKQIAVSHDNCPHQVILCGIEPSIDEALARLRMAGVMVEKLSFRSGFHSPLFEPYLQSMREIFGGFTLRPASRVPLWSATMVSPYPDEVEAIRALCFDHLTHPVRFRELIERLYDDEGVRVFVQVGMGRLVGFVDDTLKGRPYAAVSAHQEQRSGLGQLRRLVGELWCEGYELRLERVGLRLAPPTSARTRSDSALRLPLALPLIKFRTRLDVRPVGPAGPAVMPEMASVPVLAEFSQIQSDLAAMSAEVLDAWRRRQGGRPNAPVRAALGARRLARRQRYSLAEMPELVDHSFSEQPPGWPVPADSFPVVPMTRSLGTLVELAAELVPELVPVGIERVRALRWIEVEPPLELEHVAEFDGVDRVRIEIGDRLSGEVLMAPAYEPPPSADFWDVGREEVARVTAEQFYNDPEVFMFHGPAYQSVVGVGPIGELGLHGEIRCLPAPGSLLDAVGQLLGYWAAAHVTDDRVVLPFRIDQIRLFGPHPALGTRLACHVRVRELTDVWVRGDLDVHIDGRVWARIRGWEDRRFESDQRLHRVFTVPATNAYASMRPEGYCLAEERWRSTASRYFVARRYLDGDEQTQYAAKVGPAQRAWLLGRIAIKDAIRQLLWARGAGPLYPIELRVHKAADGRPLVSGPWTNDLRVSVAHKETLAVALVAEGADVGIDIERIEPRPADFVRAAFTEAELGLLAHADRDEWLTRAWVAKEAVAKARGTGLQGDPRRFVLSAIDGARLRVDGVWVCTRREGEHIVGWTEHPAIWRLEPGTHSEPE